MKQTEVCISKQKETNYHFDSLFLGATTDPTAQPLITLKSKKVIFKTSKTSSSTKQNKKRLTNDLFFDILIN